MYYFPHKLCKPYHGFISFKSGHLLIRLYFSLFFSFIVLASLAQSQAPADSTYKADSTRVTQEVVIHQQQQRIDSLVILQLQQQLKQASANSREHDSLKIQLERLVIADSVRKAEQAARIEVLKKTATGYPVNPFGDTLFFIYTQIGSVNAAERASLLAEKIKRLYKDNQYSPDSMRTSNAENETDVAYDNMGLLSVTSLDALWQNQPREKLAAGYLAKINASIQKERTDNSITNWVKRIALVLLVIGFLILIIYFINRLFRKGILWLAGKRREYFKGWRIKKAQVLQPAQQYTFVVNGLNVLRIIVILITLYLSLPLIFSVFPETEKYTETLLGWVVTPTKSILHSLTAFLPNLFTIGVVYFFTRLAIRAVSYFARQLELGNIELPGFHAEFAQPTYNIVRFLLYAFMLVIVFPYLPGSKSPAFQGVSVFLGVLVSFGSSSAISNIIAGLVITYMRPFKIGDRVKIGEVTGDVLEKTMLVTRLRTIKNEDVTIPNSSVLSSHTINYSVNVGTLGLIVHVTVTIGYNTPWKDVYEVMIKAALRTEFVLQNPKPFVLQTSLDNFSVAYQINAYTREANRQAVIYSSLMQNLQDCCNEAGIEIMSPEYHVVRRNEESTLPEAYQKKV